MLSCLPTGTRALRKRVKLSGSQSCSELRWRTLELQSCVRFVRNCSGGGTYIGSSELLSTVCSSRASETINRPSALGRAPLACQRTTTPYRSHVTTRQLLSPSRVQTSRALLQQQQKGEELVGIRVKVAIVVVLGNWGWRQPWATDWRRRKRKRRGRWRQSRRCRCGASGSIGRRTFRVHAGHTHTSWVRIVAQVGASSSYRPNDCSVVQFTSVCRA